MISFPTILLRLSVALFLGALVGLERESRDHEAGMRTNALVALGTALFTIISAFGFLEFLSLAHIQIDPTRIASYVVAGIGFLGGGVIFLRQESERAFISRVYEICKRNSIPIDGLDIRKVKDINTVKITSHVQSPAALIQVLDELRTLEGVQAVNTDVPESGKEIDREP